MYCIHHAFKCFNTIMTYVLCICFHFFSLSLPLSFTHSVTHTPSHLLSHLRSLSIVIYHYSYSKNYLSVIIILDFVNTITYLLKVLLTTYSRRYFSFLPSSTVDIPRQLVRTFTKLAASRVSKIPTTKKLGK